MAAKPKKKIARKPSATKAKPRAKRHAAPKAALHRKPARKGSGTAGGLWSRPEFLALTGVAAACVVATGVFLVQKQMPSGSAPTAAVHRATETAHAPAAKAHHEAAPAKIDTAAVQYSPVLTQAFKQAAEMNIADRIVFWSAFVQKQKDGRGDLAQLAQGHSIEDFAPLVPPAFNCTTFVETVSSLSRSNTPAEFFQNLVAMRYKNGSATFADRNHFPEIDWIPNNTKAGILADVTTQIADAAGVKAMTEAKEINRVSWLAKQLEKGKVARGLASKAQRTWAAPAHAEVRYISVKNLPKALTKVENGTVVNFVHQNSEKKPVLISHQGFLIREGGTVYLRHASFGGEIKKKPLMDYLNDLAKDPAARKWPIIGVNLNRISST